MAAWQLNGFKHHYDYVLGEEMLETFYVPMLKNSLTYDRVAGYFSSTVLSHASAGFAEFCKSPNPRESDDLRKHQPKFRLIVGARLNPRDEQVVLHANDPALLEEVEESLINSIENLDLDDEIDFNRNRFQGLSWMLKNGLLEMVLGLATSWSSNQLLPHDEAEFHAKYGIASDGENEMYFQGSVNETKRGWLDNFEDVNVSRSWAGEESRLNIETYKKKFDDLWNDRRHAKGVVVVDFPEAARQKILDKFNPRDPSGIMRSVRQKNGGRCWKALVGCTKDGMKIHRYRQVGASGKGQGVVSG